MLSIVFLHWVEKNGPVKETLVSLESIFRYTNIPYELIIVSNGSISSLNTTIKKRINKWKTKYYAPHNIKYINLKSNLGVSKGFNAGLKEIDSNTNYISIYSNDWVCSPYWAEILTDVLDDNKDVGFVTACTNWGAGSMCFDPKNPYPLPPHKFDVNDSKLFQAVEKISDILSIKPIATVENEFPAMGWTMKKEVFDDVGLMDERIFCANDVAYYKRAQLFGWKSITVWTAYLHHFWHSSFSQINDRKTYSYLKPKDKADWELILSDDYYKIKEKKNEYYT
jgi:GT2 family glycosyltransferase